MRLTKLIYFVTGLWTDDYIFLTTDPDGRCRRTNGNILIQCIAGRDMIGRIIKRFNGIPQGVPYGKQFQQHRRNASPMSSVTFLAIQQ